MAPRAEQVGGTAQTTDIITDARVYGTEKDLTEDVIAIDGVVYSLKVDSRLLLSHRLAETARSVF